MAQASDKTQMPPVLTVSQLTAKLKATLERDYASVDLEAEVSGFKRYPSGHAYFTLKDAGAQISAVEFNALFESSLRADPALAARLAAKSTLDGAVVKVRGTVSVYPPRGNYQFLVRKLRLAQSSLGALMAQYEALRQKLSAEGLFDASRKRQLPAIARRIGIVTSPAGAVIHDMCRVLVRRFENLEIRLYPSAVQGADAPRSLIAGLGYFASSSDWRADVVIVARGGGSYEDLFCFNDEALVRAVAASPIPVVSAVGHESDFTLCDFAADVRAGTPSMAAELVVPEISKIRRNLADLTARLARQLDGRYATASQRVDHLSETLSRALELSHLRHRQRLDALSSRLAPALERAAAGRARTLASLSTRLLPSLELASVRSDSRFKAALAKLGALSPFAVLERGYAVVTGPAGKALRDAADVSSGDSLSIRLASGSLTAIAS